MPEKQPGGVPPQFPPYFCVRKEGWRAKHYSLSPPGGPALYAVSLHSGWSGKPEIVLHGGPGEDAAPLATSARSSAFGRAATATLPPGPGGQAGRQEQVECRRGGGLGHEVVSFAVEVGAAGGRREAFEWRHSSGAEVAALGGRRDGYKLVRLAADAPAAAAGAAAGGAATSSDGREVVAVWAADGRRIGRGFNFQFLGAGSSGVLGERWAAMAVISALRGWDRRRRAQAAAAGAAAAGAAG